MKAKVYYWTYGILLYYVGHVELVGERLKKIFKYICLAYTRIFPRTVETEAVGHPWCYQASDVGG